jgi:hypothetical protein
MIVLVNMPARYVHHLNNSAMAVTKPIYGQLRGAAVMAISSAARHARAGSDDQGAGRRGSANPSVLAGTRPALV